MSVLKSRVCPRLRLELLTSNRSPIRLLILLAGAALIFMATPHYLYLLRQVSATESHLAKLTYIPAESSIDESDKKVQAVQVGIKRLAQPWDALFLALESAALEDIHLRTVEPDSAKGMIKLVGEAPDVYEALKYWRILSKQQALRNVMLAEYKFNEDDADSTLEFTITAVWAAQYAH